MAHADAMLVVRAQARLLASERRRLIRSEARSEEGAKIVAIGAVQGLSRFGEPGGELTQIGDVCALRVRRGAHDAREMIGEVGQLGRIHRAHAAAAPP